MMDIERLLKLGPGDKMVMTFTKNPKPTWLQQQTPAAEPAAAVPASGMAPSAPGGDMVSELTQRMGQ